MRIASLGLRAYGPFTDLPLDLSAGGFGLHVIFGPNEAGKSSALRALDAVLFGIDGRTKDNFLHEYSALRLAVTLVNARGDALTVVRRKATKNSLWNEDESDPVDDSALRPFIGALSSEEFHRVFGLDHIRLREGSDRLLDTTGGVEAVIVGAALGLNDLRSVRKAIQAEHSALFSPRASKPVINAAVAEWKRLRKDSRDGALSANEWKSSRLDAQRSAKKQSEAEALDRQLRARVAELEFGLRNRRRVVELVDLRAKLAELADTPDLDDGFADRREAARQELNTANTLLDEHSAEEEEVEGEVDSLAGDFGILGHEHEVYQLRDDSVVTGKGLKDRERRLAEAQSAEDERDRVASVLGLPTPLDAESLADLRIASGSQERCESLLTEHTRLTTSQKEATKALSAFRSELEKLGERARGEDNTVDPAPLEAAVSGALRLGDVDEGIRELRDEVRASKRDFSDAVTRLTGFTGNAEDLARLPVPGPESLDDFRTRFQSLEDEETEARRDLTRIGEQQRQIEGTIEEISSLGRVPSVADLGGVRARRDEQWDLVRRAWLEGADVDKAAQELDADTPLADSLDHSIREADEIADRMLDESERVAKLSDAQFRLGRLSTETEAADLEAGEREARRQELQEERQRAWTGSGFEVRTPAAMKDQLAERERLLEQLDATRSTTNRLDDLTNRRTAAGLSLRKALTGVGMVLPEDEPAEELSPLLLLADERRKALAKGAEERRSAEREIERLRADIATAEEGEKERSEELAEWRTHFSAATQGLPVRDDDAPSEVLRVLRQVNAILEADTEASGHRKRIGQINDDATDLVSRLERFSAAHIPKSGDEEREPSIDALTTLFEERKSQHAAFEEASKRLKKIQTKKKGAKTAVDLASRTLSDLAQDAGVSSAEDLPELIRRADEKRHCRSKLEALEKDLRGEGCPIDQTEARITDLEGVEIDVELEPLRESLEVAHEAAVTARDEALEAQKAFEAMGGDSRAAEAATEAAGVASSIREDAERYVRGVLGSQLLRCAVERFRDRNEAPMLKMASKYFSGLTLGRYARVETDIDSKGNSFFLVRESSDSASKTMDELSDGTRDQLHLALVLGSLEHRFASGSEPIPLVLDDVLVHFDDDRSVAALEVLAEFSKTTQVLLLTHHTRIREQAEALGEAQGAFVHELACDSANG